MIIFIGCVAIACVLLAIMHKVNKCYGMMWFMLVCFIVNIGSAVLLYNTQNKYPDVNELPRSNGVIQHPTYGDYAEEVEFKQGMTLMPGQSATCELSFEVKP